MLDPYHTLGVARDANDETIHQAYLRAIHRCPADQDPAKFQAIRGAYELIRTRRARQEYALFDTELPTPADLSALLCSGKRSRRPSLDEFRALLQAASCTE